MNSYFDENCELIFEGKSDYAMRILSLIEGNEWSYRIYKVVIIDK